jgi:hypothetical protein
VLRRRDPRRCGRGIHGGEISRLSGRTLGAVGTAETAEMPKRVGCQTVVIRVVLVEEEFGIHDA